MHTVSCCCPLDTLCCGTLCVMGATTTCRPRATSQLTDPGTLAFAIPCPDTTHNLSLVVHPLDHLRPTTSTGHLTMLARFRRSALGALSLALLVASPAAALDVKTVKAQLTTVSGVGDVTHT